MLLNEHNMPHIVLFKDSYSTRYDLPGGKINNGENEVDGLWRLLNRQLLPRADERKSVWELGGLVGVFQRSLVHSSPTSHPFVVEEKVAIYMVQLPEVCV